MSDTVQDRPTPPMEDWSLRIYNTEDKILIMQKNQVITLDKRSALGLATKIRMRLEPGFQEIHQND